MMSKEAMKLALEALEIERDNYQDWDEKDGAPEYIHEAITALREALAEQAQQKPFGYIKPGEGDYEKVFSWNRNERNGYTQAVYTNPPAQRKPLTDEEIKTSWPNTRFDFSEGVEDVLMFARAIEAKLKEKNT